MVSHIGEVSYPKDLGKVIGLFARDALEDFLKEHGDAYATLDKCEQKSLTRHLNHQATTFIKSTLS